MDLKSIVKQLAETPLSGTVTVVNWTQVSDGNRYVYFFCKHWTVLTDKVISDIVPGFKSTEHWQLAAIGYSGQVQAIFPGCQIKAFVRCNQKPPSVDCYELS